LQSPPPKRQHSFEAHPAGQDSPELQGILVPTQWGNTKNSIPNRHRHLKPEKGEGIPMMQPGVEESYFKLHAHPCGPEVAWWIAMKIMKVKKARVVQQRGPIFQRCFIIYL